MNTPGHFTDLAQSIEAKYNALKAQNAKYASALKLIEKATSIEESRMIAHNALSVLGVQHGAEEGKQ